MHGIPQQLKTRIDFENCHALALGGCPHCRPEEMRGHWQGLLNGRSHYQFDRPLGADEPPDGPEPEYWVMPADEDRPRQQYRLADNPAARLYALGYIEAEVADKITELEVPY